MNKRWWTFKTTWLKSHGFYFPFARRWGKRISRKSGRPERIRLSRKRWNTLLTAIENCELPITLAQRRFFSMPKACLLPSETQLPCLARGFSTTSPEQIFPLVPRPDNLRPNQRTIRRRKGSPLNCLRRASNACRSWAVSRCSEIPARFFWTSRYKSASGSVYIYLPSLTWKFSGVYWWNFSKAPLLYLVRQKLLARQLSEKYSPGLLRRK